MLKRERRRKVVAAIKRKHGKRRYALEVVAARLGSEPVKGQASLETLMPQPGIRFVEPGTGKVAFVPDTSRKEPEGSAPGAYTRPWAKEGT